MSAVKRIFQQSRLFDSYRRCSVAAEFAGKHTTANVINRSRNFNTFSVQLSGHNKWSTIKHDKAKNDAEKNKIANKFSNIISVAAKMGGPDPNQNIRLATAIEAAQKNNVLKRVIENAIKRGTGAGDSKRQVDQMIYEGVGPAGVAFVVEALTDNKNRTIGEVRSTFTKFGGSLSPSLFNFERKGYIACEKKPELTESDLLDIVLESGAEDYDVYPLEEEPTKDKDGNVIPVPDVLEVTTDASSTGNVTNILKDKFKIKEVGIAYIPVPDLMVKIEQPEVNEKYEKLKKALDDLDDVTDFYTNAVEE